MEKKIICTKNAPAPIGPYSQAVAYGDILFISGQVALDPSNGDLVTGNIQDETLRVMENLKGILEEAGLGFSNVLKTTIFLMDLKQFGAVNEVYGRYFETNPPARETVQIAGLPRGVNVEISMVAGK